MKKHEFEAAAITLGGKKIGTLIVSVELANDLRFNPWLPDEPELPDGEADEPEFSLGDEFVKSGF